MNKLRLVIDASVARAAGDKPTDPSKSCYNFLYKALNLGYQVVFTKDILDEWDRHQSRVTAQWRRSMIAKKQVVTKTTGDNEALWRKIKMAIETLDPHQHSLDNVYKDFRLIEAALATDQIIVSLDDNTARKPYAVAAQTVNELKKIVWVNPDKPSEEPLVWLDDGAKPEPKRLLQNYDWKTLKLKK